METNIDLTDREFLINLREACLDAAEVDNLSPSWARAYLSLADAADRLDAMNARITVRVVEAPHKLVPEGIG